MVRQRKVEWEKELTVFYLAVYEWRGFGVEWLAGQLCVQLTGLPIGQLKGCLMIWLFFSSSV